VPCAACSRLVAYWHQRCWPRRTLHCLCVLFACVVTSSPTRDQVCSCCPTCKHHLLQYSKQTHLLCVCFLQEGW
jgi:hypothetical protein